MLQRTIKRSIVLYIAILLVSCGCGKKSTKGIEERRVRLASLKKEELYLIRELEQVIYLDSWDYFSKSTLKKAKEKPASAKEWLAGTTNTIFSLYETKTNIVQRSFRTSESLNQILKRIQTVGFKARDREEAIESLETWEKVLKNINEQHKLREELSKK